MKLLFTSMHHCSKIRRGEGDGKGTEEGGERRERGRGDRQDPHCWISAVRRRALCFTPQRPLRRGETEEVKRGGETSGVKQRRVKQGGN